MPTLIKPYVDALKSPNVDSSDFVLLTTRILTEKLGVEATNKISAIQQDYVQSRYADALGKIKQLCDEYQDEINDETLITLIKEKEFTVLDNPLKDESRRYFETKFSQAVWNDQNETQFKALAKLSAFMKEKLDENENIAAKDLTKANEIQRTLPDEVTDLKLATKVIGDMRAFGEIHKSISETEMNLRKPVESIANMKDRGTKRIGDTDKLYSLNPGIVKASSPLPLDDRLKEVKTNRLPDMFNIDAGKKGYSSQRKDVPFVNSVSGTTFTLASVLKGYIEQYQNDPKLEEDVNNIVKAFVSFTNANGFHSLAEMIDVINDSEVQAVFKQANININMDFLARDKLTTIMNTTADFCKQVRLQQSVNATLLQGNIALSDATKVIRYADLPQTIPFILISNGVKENAPTVSDVTLALEKICTERGAAVGQTALNNFIKYAEHKLPQMDLSTLKELNMQQFMLSKQQAEHPEHPKPKSN